MPEKQNPNQNQTEQKERQSVDDQSKDMKQREYRSSDGEVHHHTKKYMEEHERSKKKED